MSTTHLSLVFLFWVAVASAVPVEYANHTEDKRISYGYDADIKEAKYYAFFRCNAWCGATLLTTTRLVTAAHCVTGCQAKNAFVDLGMNSRSDMDQGKSDRYKIASIRIHPKYPPTGDGANWDVAILYVAGVVRITDKVAPINYALSKPPLNNYIMCVGYGKTQSVDYPNKLQKSWFLTKRYQGNLLISNAEKTSVLSGDSGGPCIYNNQFVANINIAIYVNGKTYEDGAVMSAQPEILSFYRANGL